MDGALSNSTATSFLSRLPDLLLANSSDPRPATGLVAAEIVPPGESKPSSDRPAPTPVLVRTARERHARCAIRPSRRTRRQLSGLRFACALASHRSSRSGRSAGIHLEIDGGKSAIVAAPAGDRLLGEAAIIFIEYDFGRVPGVAAAKADDRELGSASLTKTKGELGSVFSRALPPVRRPTGPGSRPSRDDALALR
jgi:hypothetical protein